MNRRHALQAAPVVLAFLLALLGPYLFDRESIRPIDPSSSALRPPGSQVTLLERASEEGVLVVEDLHRVDEETWQYSRRGEITTLGGDDFQAHDRVHWLGTDRVGRDVAALVMRGARTSIAIGVLSALLALVVGSIVGGVAGAGPGWFDRVLMRSVDALLTFPQLVLVLLLAVLFKPSPVAVVLIVGLTSWMGIARMVRAEILQLRSAAFVLSARGIGASPARILSRHLLPNALGPALIATSLLVGDAILVESALSFLGLGTGGESPTWGRLVAEGRGDLVRAWWISAFPGLAITLTVLVAHQGGAWLASVTGLRREPNRALPATRIPLRPAPLEADPK